MTPASRGTFSGLAEPAQSVDECGTPSPESRMRSRPPTIGFTEGPVEISDDANFNDLEGSEEGPDIGYGEQPGASLDYFRAHRDRVARRCLRLMPGPSLRMELMLYNCFICQLDRELNCH